MATLSEWLIQQPEVDELFADEADLARAMGRMREAARVDVLEELLHRGRPASDRGEDFDPEDDDDDDTDGTAFFRRPGPSMSRARAEQLAGATLDRAHGLLAEWRIVSDAAAAILLAHARAGAPE